MVLCLNCHGSMAHRYHFYNKKSHLHGVRKLVNIAFFLKQLKTPFLPHLDSFLPYTFSMTHWKVACVNHKTACVLNRGNQLRQTPCPAALGVNANPVQGGAAFRVAACSASVSRWTRLFQFTHWVCGSGCVFTWAIMRNHKIKKEIALQDS